MAWENKLALDTMLTKKSSQLGKLISTVLSFPIIWS